LIQIQDLASELRVQLIGQTQGLGVENLPIMNEYAKSQIDRLGNLLNAEVAGRFIFSGDKSGTAPIIDTETMKANFAAAVNTTVNAGGGNSATQIQAAADTWFNAKGTTGIGNNPFAVTNGSPIVTTTQTNHGLVVGDQITFSSVQNFAGLDLNGTFTVASVATNTYTFSATTNATATTTGGAAAVTQTANSWNKLGTLATTSENTIRTAVGLDISYGEIANQETFANLFEVLNIFANVTIGTGQKAEYRTLVDNSRLVVEAAFESVNQMIADLGGDQARLEAIERSHETDIGLLTKQLGTIEDVDSFEAINRFQAIRSQLEASYQITSASRGFSLINFI
jgi:flagellin-like hook-associated protein FlgL